MVVYIYLKCEEFGVGVCFFVEKCEVNISINCWFVMGMYNKDIV